MHYLPDDYYIAAEADKLKALGPFHIDCAFCRGTGVHPATMKLLNHRQCHLCRGTGLVHFFSDRKNFSTCPHCLGKGRESEPDSIKPCNHCGGKGIV